MHHTNLWRTKLYLSDWRFALYLHFPYLRFPSLHIRTCVFRTCVFHPCEMRCFVLAFSVHAFSSTCVFSAPATGHTIVFITRIFVEIGMHRMLWLFHIFCSDVSIACPLFNLVRNSVVHSPSSVIRGPRYRNVSTCSSSSLWISMRHAMPSLAITLVLSTLMSRLYLRLTRSRRSTNSCMVHVCRCWYRGFTLARLHSLSYCLRTVQNLDLLFQMLHCYDHRSINNCRPAARQTRSSATPEGPRDALSLSKSCQMLHNCSNQF